MVLGEPCLNLTVIIPTRNRPEQAQRRVDELKNLNCEVTVVDDCSQTPVEVHGAKIVRNHQRLGASESWNVGSKLANHDWLFLLSDDLVPSAGLTRFVNELIPKLDSRDVVGFRISGVITLGTRTVQLFRNTLISRILNIIFGVDISRHTGPSRFTPSPMLFHSELFASLGGFDSHTYGGNGFREESDLQWRAGRKGARLIYVEDPYFEHLNIPGGYEKRRVSANDFYYMRNQTVFALRKKSPASVVMIAAFGTYMLTRGLRLSMLVRGIAQGFAAVI